MRTTVLSILLLLLTVTVQAQPSKCVNRFIPYPEEQAAQARATTRAVVGNPKKYSGERKGLIILMEFKDVKFVNKNKNGKDIDVHDFWNDIANKEGLKNVNGVLVNGSIGDYFRDQSYGQFNLVFDVRGPYTAKNKYAYYGRNVTYGGSSFDQNPVELIIEACQAADKEVDFKDYDWDEDGVVDQVYVIYAGHGEASYDDADLIWPHASDLSDWGQSLTLQNVAIDSYACGNELDSADRTMGIGTICHEFSHCLGLPDVYNVETGESVVGGYDVMDAGNYNGDSWYPAGYSSFERYFCGWIEPKSISGLSQVGDLEPLHLSPDAYIINPFVGSTNYYLIEKRQKTSWDKFLPCFTNSTAGENANEKVLYWYIDYEKEKWNSDRPNNDPEHLGISLIDAEQVPAGSGIMVPGLADSHPVAWYDLQGHLLPGLPSQRGIYVVRQSDGTTRKYIR